MHQLVADPNSRVRLIAAGSLLSAEPDDADAGAVLVEALGDPALRVREAALDLFESLGDERCGDSRRPEGTRRAGGGGRNCRTLLDRLIERLENQAGAAPQPVAAPE